MVEVLKKEIAARLLIREVQSAETEIDIYERNLSLLLDSVLHVFTVLN